MRKITVLTCGMVIAALVGCGTQPAAQTSSDFDTFEDLTASVAENTAAKPSVHFDLTMEVAGQSFTGNGAGNLGAQPALRMTMSVPPAGQMDMRLVGDVLYLRLPQEITPGKPWVRVDPNGNDPISRTLGAGLRQLKQNGDPSQTLKQFEGAGVITAKADEQLNGKATTRYSITIDMKKVAASQTDPDLRKMIDQALQSGVDTFPMQLWLDQENLPVRTTMEIPFKNPSTQQVDQIRISIDYSEWGKPVEVSAPPAEQVSEVPR
jgi:hypothetical protein